jgi:hypothetical protein
VCPFHTAGSLVTVHWGRGKARVQSINPSDSLVGLFTQKSKSSHRNKS